MKKAKILILAVCAVLLVVASVLGTFAYLTSKDTVVNTFTVGQVDIALDETKVTPDGVPVENADRVKENSYHLVPGMTYTKDPRMTVLANSEEAYVRMIVTIDHYKELTAIFGDPFLPQYFVSDWDAETWVSTEVIAVDEAANTATYEFRYKETVKKSDSDTVLEPLFKSITMPGEVTGEEIATIADLEITVVGHAIQATGFADANAAWTAFDAQINS